MIPSDGSIIGVKRGYSSIALQDDKDNDLSCCDSNVHLNKKMKLK